MEMTRARGYLPIGVGASAGGQQERGAAGAGRQLVPTIAGRGWHARRNVSGERQAASGTRQAARGKRHEASGKRQAVSGKRQVVSGKR